jgi:pimeloyl-ACP methyl ester carboxylesterase
MSESIPAPHASAAQGGQGSLLRDAESMLVAVNEREQLHMRHFAGGPRHCTVVLLHGLNEDGSVFFRHADSLAPLLVRDGFDVWVPDLRGKGRSWPALTPELAAQMNYGFHAAVTEDLATVFGQLRDDVPDKPVFLVGHGVGGLLWLSFLARWPIVREMLRGVVLIGSATSVRPQTVRDRFYWSLRAGWYARWLVRRHGVLTGRATGLGDGAEVPRFGEEIRALLEGNWVDPADGLDHAAQLRSLGDWPPTLLLAAERDSPWADASAVRRLQAQLPPHDGRLYVFPKETGVRLLGPRGALAGGAGARDVQGLVLDWLAAFDG